MGWLMLIIMDLSLIVAGFSVVGDPSHCGFGGFEGAGRRQAILITSGLPSGEGIPCGAMGSMILLVGIGLPILAMSTVWKRNSVEERPVQSQIPSPRPTPQPIPLLRPDLKEADIEDLARQIGQGMSRLEADAKALAKASPLSVPEASEARIEKAKKATEAFEAGAIIRAAIVQSGSYDLNDLAPSLLMSRMVQEDLVALGEVVDESRWMRIAQEPATPRDVTEATTIFKDYFEERNQAS